MTTRIVPPISALNIRDVPRHLQRRFREACEREGRSMRDMILEFMREVVGQQENSREQGANR